MFKYITKDRIKRKKIWKIAERFVERKENKFYTSFRYFFNLKIKCYK